MYHRMILLLGFISESFLVDVFFFNFVLQQLRTLHVNVIKLDS